MEMKKNNQRKGKFIDSRKYIVVFNISIFISMCVSYNPGKINVNYITIIILLSKTHYTLEVKGISTEKTRAFGPSIDRR